MLEEIEDDEAAARFEDSMGFGQGLGRRFGVVESLGEDGEIDGGIVDRRGLDIAEAVFEVWEVVFFGELLAEFDHLFGVVDGDDFFGALGDELGKSALAGAEVGNHIVVEDLEHGFGEAFPGAAGDVFAAELSGEFVEVGADLVFALAEDVAEGGVVFFTLGELGTCFADDFFQSGRDLGGVDVVFSRALIGDEAFFFELGELGRDP